jgi:hypothetical protein
MAKQPSKISNELTEAEIAWMKRQLWIKGELNWKLHSTQELIDARVKSTNEEYLILCSRQLGKSWWSIKYALEYAIKNPGSIVRIAADTLKQISDIVNDNLEPFCADAPKGFITKQKSSLRWEIGFKKGPNGRKSSIRLGCLARAHVDTLRGGNAGLVIAEEGGFVRSSEYKYAIEDVIGAQLLRSGGRLIHVTTPSEDLLHYIHTTVKPACDAKGSTSSYTIYDNPQLTPEQIAKAMHRARGEHTDTWKREYLAQILPIRERLIVPEFVDAEVDTVKQSKHCDATSYWLSGDFGGSRDLHVFHIWMWNWQTNKKQVLSELWFPNKTGTQEIIIGIKKWESEVLQKYYGDTPGTLPEGYARFIDPGGSHQLIIDLCKDGLQCGAPNKTEMLASLNDLRDEIYNRKIEIDPSCGLLITTLRSGMWNSPRTDWERSDALGHCDSIASAMYGNRDAICKDMRPAKTGYFEDRRRAIASAEKRDFARKFTLR